MRNSGYPFRALCSLLLPIALNLSVNTGLSYGADSALTLQMHAPNISAQPSGDLMQSMRKELNRSFSLLKNAGDAPLYFLSYTVYDTVTLAMQSDYGALYSKDDVSHNRVLDVDLRVGSQQLDNTHKMRGGDFGLDSFRLDGLGKQFFPLEDDPWAIRSALWERTDSAFKDAQKKYSKVKVNRGVKVQEDDLSADFSVEPAREFKDNGSHTLDVDRASWENRVKKLSGILGSYKGVQDCNVSFNATATRRFLVNSEGSNIQDERKLYRVSAMVKATAADGMKLWLYDGVEANAPEQLPDDAALEKMARKLAEDITALTLAPRAEPYTGPAILRAKAAGVFFHEIFGHRIEGHRQKDESEGRTFARKMGQQVMPSIISVTDDPTLEKLGKNFLNGAYRFDDEGVPAQKVVLVENGVLKSYLMSRSPVKDCSKSNGHGRCSPGKAPVARQGNLIVDSSRRVPYSELKQMLVAEVKKQGKEYGLIFDEIAGGFTMTQTFMPQSFKLLPLRVTRVYADGRPDQLLRGVDLVGTPLTSLEKILCAADDDDTFNGTCGAESGWVPVSASSPSLLVGTIEVELQDKGQDKPPLLPSPVTVTDTNTESAKQGAKH